MVIIQDYTTKDPLEMIGREAGICYNSDTADPEKNIKRGINNLLDEHGRTFEYPQVYMVLDDYSARVMREFYTHIGGDPTRLQMSTRYVSCNDFKYYNPFETKTDKSIVTFENELSVVYKEAMECIRSAYDDLLKKGASKEDAANILPLGMMTTVVVRTNLRQLIDMSHQRLCTRAYKEFRVLMNDIKNALAAYSPQWNEIVKNTFEPKCEYLGWCPEKKSCGRKERKTKEWKR